MAGSSGIGRSRQSLVVTKPSLNAQIRPFLAKQWFLSTGSEILQSGATPAMGRNLQRAIWLMVMFTSSLAFAQQACEGGLRIDGTVSDPTGAMIPGATVQAASGEVATTDAAGRYVLPCVHAAAIVLTATAQGFASVTFEIQRHAGETAHFDFKLAVEDVRTQVQVNGDPPGVDGDGGAGTVTLKDEETAAAS